VSTNRYRVYYYIDNASNRFLTAGRWDGGGLHRDLDGIHHLTSDTGALVNGWRPARLNPVTCTDLLKVAAEDGYGYNRLIPMGLGERRGNRKVPWSQEARPQESESSPHLTCSSMLDSIWTASYEVQAGIRKDDVPSKFPKPD